MFAIYWVRDLSLRVVCVPIETLLENTNFSFVSGYKLGIASVLWLGPWVSFPSQGWDPIGPDLCGSCAYCLRLCGLTWASVWCLEGLVSFVSSILSGAYNLFFTSSAGFLEPRGRILIETSHLGVFQVSHSLDIAYLWVSAFVPIYGRRNHL